MTETFSFPVITETSGDIEYTVIGTKFGDGYAQEVKKGMNNAVGKWRVTFTGTKAECQEVMDFLDEHGGAVSFFWTPPLGAQGYYKCKRVSPSQPHPPRFRLAMEFEQHFLP